MLSEHKRNYDLGMDALVTVCSSNTNGIMVWAWMLWSSYALPTRTEVWFGHGCSGHCMLFQHERKYGLGMDALVSVCSSNTNGSMVWAWMLWSAYALPTRTELLFGHRCSGHRMLSEHERNYGLHGHVSQHQGVHGFARSRGSVRRLMGFGGSWVRGVQGFAELPGFAGVVGSRVRCVRGFAGFAGLQVHGRGFAGSRARGLAGSRVRGFAGSRVRGFAGSRVRRFAGFAGFAGSRVRGFAGSRGSRGSRVRGFGGFGGFAGSRVRGFAGSQVRGFAASQGSRLRGFAASRLRGFAASRVRGFAGSRVRGSAGSRVRGFARFARIPRAIMFMSATRRQDGGVEPSGAASSSGTRHWSDLCFGTDFRKPPADLKDEKDSNRAEGHAEGQRHQRGRRGRDLRDQHRQRGVVGRHHDREAHRKGRAKAVKSRALVEAESLERSPHQPLHKLSAHLKKQGWAGAANAAGADHMGDFGMDRMHENLVSSFQNMFRSAHQSEPSIQLASG